MIQAAKYGQDEEAAEAIELTEEEKVMEAKLRVMWKFYFVYGVYRVYIMLLINKKCFKIFKIIKSKCLVNLLRCINFGREK